MLAGRVSGTLVELCVAEGAVDVGGVADLVDLGLVVVPGRQVGPVVLVRAVAAPEHRLGHEVAARVRHDHLGELRPRRQVQVHQMFTDRLARAVRECDASRCHRVSAE